MKKDRREEEREGRKLLTSSITPWQPKKRFIDILFLFVTHFDYFKEHL